MITLKYSFNLYLWVKRNYFAAKNQRLWSRVDKAYWLDILIPNSTNLFLIAKCKHWKVWIKYELQKTCKYRKMNIGDNIAIFKIFLPKICHELDKHLPNSL